MEPKAMTLKQLGEEIAGKSKTLADIFAECKTTVDGENRYDLSKSTKLQGDSAARAAEIKRLNEELSGLGVERDQRRELTQAAEVASKTNQEFNAPQRGGAFPGNGTAQVKSLGQLFVESQAYKGFMANGRYGPAVELKEVDMKAVFRTGAGWTPLQVREPGFVPAAMRPIAVVDFIPTIPTSADTIRYMAEGAITDVAAETAESTATTAADLIPEATRSLTEQTQPVQWIPVFLPVTMQQMEDVEGIQAYVEQTLTLELQRRLDQQILRGNGTAPNLLGTNNVASIQTTAKGVLPTPDAVYQTFRKIRALGFGEPSVTFWHPNDWEDIRLLRTADGLYIWGNPSEAGPERIWAVPVVQTTAALENTVTTGDYTRFATLHIKRGVTVEVSDSHAHYFTRGMLAIRLDMRAAVVHRRASAFGTVTGV